MLPGVAVIVPFTGAVASTVRATDVPVPRPPEEVPRTLIVSAPVKPVGLPVQVQGEAAPLTTPATQFVPLFMVYSHAVTADSASVSVAVITGAADVKLPDVGVTVTVPTVGGVESNSDGLVYCGFTSGVLV